MDCSPPGSSVDKSQLPSPPPGDLPNPGIEQGSPALQVDSLPAELPRKPQQSVRKITGNNRPFSGKDVFYLV